MDRTLSMDLGTSATKLALVSQDGQLLHTGRASRPRNEEELAQTVSAFLAAHSLSWESLSQVVLTGVGAGELGQSQLPCSLSVVAEFDASAAGALALTGLGKAVVATLGTGTAFLWAERGQPPRHLCGTGIGGGTLAGLSQQLFGPQSFDQLCQLAEAGSPAGVDLTIADVSQEAAETLDPEMTASNFGRLTTEASQQDQAAGVFNLVLQAIGTMTVLACQICSCKAVVVTGSIASLPLSVENFRFFERLYGIHYAIPENSGFATAYGAALCKLQ